ncbi:isocitrate lyase/PEP mutase family protein [Pseudazoarcus pumilus]|uniref:3-methyl-2-oxobutanoate hydroxymethyltransferase n=1 Tax=Pseudazoarcus pumilus TaxID=2067960 RepID=A0A2I6SA46_9RHOO|nr:isocitrate lyase/phosphoenolpyruvate mutase family protein [Pseudazoarcus pumilus]AUN96133.1 3-methyl-2-oxobutanoate hydroxymethyltransferase [Pseudazoarcus pumilus]
MSVSTISPAQRERARRLTALHHSGTALALPNAWDAASARVFEAAGAQAIGTSSAGIAFSRGYPDGERTPLAEMIDVVRRMVAVVDVPVTVDIEAGYGATREAVLETVRAVIDAGAVGVNLEDAPTDRPGELRDTAEQAGLIAAVRALASEAGIDLYINARTDVFWLRLGSAESRLEATLARLRAYRDAGASGVFVPGVTDADTIAALVSGAACPLNVLAGPGCPDIAGMTRLGVARVSVGSGPARAIMALTRRIGIDLLEHGRFDAMLADTIPYAEANALFERR